IYRAGRCGLSGAWRRRKWTASATVKVLGHHATKHSVRVACADGAEICTVTIPPNRTMPKPGEWIEIPCLDGHRDGGISQRTFRGVRADKTAADAVDTLQFKGEGR